MIITLSAIIALLSLLAGCGNLANVSDSYQDDLKAGASSKIKWVTYDGSVAPQSAAVSPVFSAIGTDSTKPGSIEQGASAVGKTNNVADFWTIKLDNAGSSPYQSYTEWVNSGIKAKPASGTTAATYSILVFNAAITTPGGFDLRFKVVYKNREYNHYFRFTNTAINLTNTIDPATAIYTYSTALTSTSYHTYHMVITSIANSGLLSGSIYVDGVFATNFSQTPAATADAVSTTNTLYFGAITGTNGYDSTVNLDWMTFLGGTTINAIPGVLEYPAAAQ